MKSITVVAAPLGSVEIQDPFPTEGYFMVHFDSSETKTFDATVGQYTRVKPQLDALMESGQIISYAVNETEVDRSDELLELKERTARVVTISTTGGAAPNLVTLGVRPGDVFVKHVAVGPVNTSYTVAAVHAANVFETTTLAVAFDILAAGDSYYFTRDGVVITGTLKTVGAGGVTHVIAAVSQSPYQRTGYGEFFVKASDGKPYFKTGTGTELNLGMTGADPLIFKGAIAVNTDFPKIADVKNGWFYRVTADVTDNAGATYTNTLQSYPAGSEVAWNGTNWTEMGDASVAGAVILVDGNRTDTYTEDGSPLRPYKTLTDALATATAGKTVVAAYKTASPYAENIVVPAGVSLEGISGNYTYIDGNITMGTSPCSLKYIVSAGVTNVLTINGGTTMRDYFSYGRMSLPLATSKAQMWNCHINSTTQKTVTLAHADAEFYSVMGKLSTTGDNRVIDSIGKVILDLVEVTSPAGATQDAVYSATSGYLRIFNSSVVNLGAAKAINAANAAGAAAPNVLNGVIVSSGGANAVSVGTAVTLYDNVSSASGTITGAGIVAQNGQQFDSRQHTAASETLFAFRAMRPGYIAAANAETAVTAGAGETMTLDVRIAGVTSLTTPIPFAAGAPLANVPVPGTIDATKRTFAAGDLVTVVRVWGAGAAGLVDTVCSIDVRYF